ncbi:MAG: tetraacyldisaccharide 4'-kinase [Nitrospirae bacterium]|nr:tetraacyldisaccharide 4'-kinase [Nitrospirota bacterium]
MGPFSSIYNMILSVREFLYKTSLKDSKRLPSKVVSIGNLTLGGTGKTPAVIALAQAAKKRGFKPCVLTRGYRGKMKTPCMKSIGNEPCLNTHLAGDEPVLMTYRLPDIPVVIGRNRYFAGMSAINETGKDAINIFILDDGFQHWALYRDLDILLIDATNPFGNNKLFPEGILREPLKSMSRADIIVLTKTDAASRAQMDALILKIKRYNPHAPLYPSSHMPVSFVNAKGTVRDIDFINKKRVYAFSGIANPMHFKTSLTAIGAEVVKFNSFRDHYKYRQQDIDMIMETAGGLEIITTEKDLVKLMELNLPEKIFALRIDFSVDKAFYDDIFGRM